MAADSLPDLDHPSERRAALRRYGVLDTPPEESFDRLTSLAAAVCDAPTSLITLIDVDEGRQWFKSCFGFDRRETDLELSFCVHAVHAKDVLVVEDATADPRFADNPLVTDDPGIRFYAGAPLRTPEGVLVGTLCILDYEPRTFDAAQREHLERLADLVVSQLELRSAEAQMRPLIDDNPQPMLVCAADGGTVLYANAAAREQYGYDADTLRSLSRDDLRAPAHLQPSGDGAVHERADGSQFSVQVRERTVRLDGHPARLLVPQRRARPSDAAPTVFFRADPDGTIRSLSAEWTEATGRPVDETVDTALLDLVPPADRSTTADALSSLLDGEADACRHEARLRTTDGTRPFEMDVRSVRDERNAAGLVGTLTPVAPERSDEPEAETDAGDDTSDVFPSNMPSFDDGLGAPSSPDGADADAASDGEPARSASPSQDGNDDRTDASPDEQLHDPFDLRDCLSRLVDDRKENAASDVELRCSLPDEAVPVRLDPDAVDDMVGTLLDNALSNTAEGTVEVRTEADDDTVTIQVTDTGSGVEERFMEVYMDAAAGDRSGLQHVQQLAGRMGGVMNMRDAEDGTRFVLELPRSTSSDAPVADE